MRLFLGFWNLKNIILLYICELHLFVEIYELENNQFVFFKEHIWMLKEIKNSHGVQLFKIYAWELR